MKLFIGCSSSNDIPDYYNIECKKLITELLKENDLVYGAYNEGIMGICYNTAKDNKRNISAICTSVYKDDIRKIDCDNKIIVNNICDRTYTLLNECDSIIILPGGIGTINELMVSIDSKRCGELDKPIIVYNANHFFDELLVFLDKIYNEKFTDSSVKNCYKVTYTIKETINYLNNIKK